MTAPVMMPLGGLAGADLGQAGLEHGDDEHAEERPDDGALAAHQAGAADDDRGDRGELHADAAVGIGRRQPGDLEHRSGGGERPRDDEGHQLDPTGGEPREPRRPLVGADGDEVTAPDRAGQDDLPDEDDGDGGEEGRRDPQPGDRLRQPLDARADVLGLRVGDPIGGAAATSSMPRVTMNEGIDQATQTAPLRNPQAAPTARQSATDGQSGQPQPAMAIPSTAPESASTEPTERSIPPAMTTSVMPAATTIRSGTWLTTLWSVRQVQKFRLNSPNRTIKADRTSSRPRTSARPARRRRGLARWSRRGHGVVRSSMGRSSGSAADGAVGSVRWHDADPESRL